ncbi:MAG: sulfite exporter TauE/SafE family protein [Dehalococcoidia bacterium]
MRKQFGIYALIGAAAGLFSGLMGVGGGLIIVPMSVGVLKLSQHQAHGTSLAAIVPIGLFAAIVYAFRGHMDWALVAQLGLGSMVGVVLGAKLMMRVPAKRLQQGFGALLLVVGLRLLIWGA